MSGEGYGWVAPGATVSGLEDEYELSSRLPRLLYVKEPAPDREAGLAKLLARFQTEGSVSYRKFTGPDELGRLIADDLAVLLSERFGAAPYSGSPRLHRPRVPVPLTPTIGRRREIAAVTALLRGGARLVTITGTGGVGKSRLATGRPEECWRHLGLAAAIYDRTPHVEGISYALEIAAAASLASHDVDQAADAAALAQELRDMLRLPVWPVLHPLHDRLTAELHTATSGRERRPATPSSDPAAVLQRICEHHRTPNV